MNKEMIELTIITILTLVTSLAFMALPLSAAKSMGFF